MKKISVIIPTYKPQSFLWQCLDSLGAQTLSITHFEVLLILNGCNNPYLKQILNYKSKSLLDLQVFQTDESGVSNARNIGLRHAKGEFITFVDDDDFVSPTYLEALLAVSDKNVIGISRPIAFTEGVNTSQSYQITNEFDKNYPATNIPILKVRRYLSGPCMKLIHKNLIGKHIFNTNFSVGEDGLFIFSITDKMKRCTLANPSAIYYRRYRENSLTSKRTGSFIRCNNFLLWCELTKIYFMSPLKYSLFLYIVQTLSCFKGICIATFKRDKILR